ncbi:hypothetical protein VTJ04DRAFT_9646 [Mycothermus thermophilus]|uniref:uncharacterized protein n=1 Tax=Humicola insolens TaxID=85995 RepID=UPI003743B0A2
MLKSDPAAPTAPPSVPTLANGSTSRRETLRIFRSNQSFSTGTGTTAHALPTVLENAPDHRKRSELPGEDATESDAQLRFAEIEARYLSTLAGYFAGASNASNAPATKPSKCSPETMMWRKEWTALTPEEKRSFIASVYCLSKFPSQTNETVRSQATGVRTRFDDFVLSHIVSTPFVHTNGLFLPFHRHLLYLFDSDLRLKCGFTGPFPYFDWSRTWKDPRQHPVFDGSPLSLGGNGKMLPDTRPPIIISLPPNETVVIPPATGGGCVTDGPFSKDKFEVHLGPIGYEPQGPNGGLGNNPRCIQRDLSPYWSRFTAPSKVVSMIDDCGDDLGCFNLRMDYDETGQPGGVHAAGH